MTVAVMILAIGVGIMLEQLVPSSVFIGFAKPPILMCVVAYYAMNHSAPRMLFVALTGGILCDGIAALPLGVTPLALAAGGTIVHHYRNVVFSGKLATNIFFGTAVGICAPLTVFILLLFLGHAYYSIQLRIMVLKIICTAVYGAVLFPVIYASLERLESLTGTCTLNRFPDESHSNN